MSLNHGPRGGKYDYSSACTCDEAKKPVAERQWRVNMRRCNYSAFNGYKRTPSDYSEVQCQGCQRRWRTKAAYVDQLEDAPDDVLA